MTTVIAFSEVHPEFISIAELIDLIKLYGKKSDKETCARILIDPYYELLNCCLVLKLDSNTGIVRLVGCADEEDHPDLLKTFCDIIAGAYLGVTNDIEKDPKILMQLCHTIGLARKQILERISDKGADFWIDVPVSTLTHAKSYSGRTDKTIPLSTLHRIREDNRRELLTLRRNHELIQKKEDVPAIPDRPLSQLEQAKAAAQSGTLSTQQRPIQHKKDDPREVASCHKLISILLDMADIDLTHPHKAAGLINAHAASKGLVGLSEQTIVESIKKSKLIRNNN